MALIGEKYSAHQPLIKDRKQKVRLWFEFYKLALQDPELTDLVEASRGYYASWGDISSVTFDTWWTTHSHLFPPTEVEVITAKKTSNISHTLNVAVPLNQSVNQTIAQLKAILQTARETKAGSTEPIYAFTDNNFNGPIINQILELYRYYLLAEHPPIGKEFVIGYLENYLKPKKRQKWVPKLFWELYAKYRRGDDIAPAMRSLRTKLDRYIRSAEKLKIAASTGKFPGKYF